MGKITFDDIHINEELRMSHKEDNKAVKLSLKELRRGMACHVEAGELSVDCIIKTIRGNGDIKFIWVNEDGDIVKERVPFNGAVFYKNKNVLNHVGDKLYIVGSADYKYVVDRYTKNWFCINEEMIKESFEKEYFKDKREALDLYFRSRKTLSEDYEDINALDLYECDGEFYCSIPGIMYKELKWNDEDNDYTDLVDYRWHTFINRSDKDISEEDGNDDRNVEE